MKPVQYQRGYCEFYKQSLKNSQNNPIQYSRGYCEFYKLKFKVTSDVLIPRPETELLVDEVIKRVKSYELRVMNEKNNSALKTLHSTLTILDIGTGSGCIAISLAKNLSLHLEGGKLKIIAIDISAKALNVARQNAKLHGVEDRIEFIQSDLLSSVILNPKGEGSQDSESGDSSQARNDNLVIVANLPYIPTSRIPQLDSSVKDFEPHLALDGGADGFELYRKLFTQISLQPLGLQPKLIICEIDDTHGDIAKKEAEKYFPQAKIEIKKDLARKNRMLLISL